MRFHLIPFLMVVLLLVLGANYQGGNQYDNQVAKSAPRMERSSVLGISTIRNFDVRNKNSKPIRVSNRNNSGAVSGTSDVRNRSSNRNTGSVSTSSTKPTDGRKQQSKPEPITNKPSVPTTPQPTEPS